MVELFELGIPEFIGPRYMEFSINLGIDDEQLEVIRAEYRNNIYRTVEKILRLWLRGIGLPVTWKSLIQALRLSGLRQQADRIEILKGECRKVILKLYTQVEKSFL